MVMAHFEASPLAAAKVLPISRLSISATTGISPSNSSAARVMRRDRSRNDVARQEGKASAANERRRSTSSGVKSSYVETISPVAGFTET